MEDRPYVIKDDTITLAEILKEFIMLLSAIEPLSKSDSEFLEMAKKHLAGNPVPNPGGFLVDIPRVIDPHMKLTRLCKAAKDLEASGINLTRLNMPQPLKRVIAEALLLAKLSQLRENIPRAWSSLG